MYACPAVKPFPPTVSAAPLGCVLRVFRPLTVADVVTVVRILYPLPTRLLKDSIDVLAGTVLRQVIQSVADSWRRADFFQVGLHHAATEDGRPRPRRL